MFGGIFGRQQPRPDPQTSPEVAAALVRADETVRRGTDELGYATAQFGDAATRDLAVALDQAQGRLQEAFRLNGLLLDDDPETPEESRSLETAVLAATVEIDRLLRPPVDAFAARRAALQEAPTAIARLRAEVTDIRGRVSDSRTAVDTLRGRYSDDAVVAVADNPDQAEALLGFSERSLALAERRHGAGRGEEAIKAIQVASDSVRRAEDLLDAVTDFEVEAVHAESTLTAVLADSRGDIVEARQMLASIPDPQIEAAADNLGAAVAAASTPVAGADPFTTLNRLRAANSALEELVQERQTRPERERQRAQLTAALDDADRQIALARTMISDHPAQVGPEARTRLAQAERLLGGIEQVQDAASALLQARQAADLAAEAAAIAQRDIQSSGWGEPDWGGPARGGGMGGGGMGGVLGGVLGGMVLGGILDDFDMDFD
jgi:hypothetical protein